MVGVSWCRGLVGLGVIALVVAGVAGAGPARAEEGAEAGELRALGQALKGWLELQRQTIAIRDIAGAGDATLDETQEHLRLRLRSLLLKKRSNREWETYWGEQVAATEALRAEYEALVPAAGGGGLERALEGAKRTRAALARLHGAMEDDGGDGGGLEAKRPGAVGVTAWWRERVLGRAEVTRPLLAAERARAEEEVRRLSGLVEQARGRREVLAAWAALARRKVANQDRYLRALDGEIGSVQAELHERGEAAATGERASSLKACDVERGGEGTPFGRYRACEQALESEVDALGEAQSALGQAEERNRRRQDTLAELAEAQAADEVLAREELAIAGGEALRAEASGEETEPWRAVWGELEERASKKVAQLGEAARSTKEARRTAAVDEAFLASEQVAIERQLGQARTALLERTQTGQLVVAVLETAWHFVRGAWLVPLYALLAWLVLRGVGRTQRRLLARVTARAKNKDEIQRAETLAIIVRGALKLVVFIVTGLLCLEAVGVNTTPLLGGAAIFGLAISFGSQSLVKDFVTGFFIILENQYAVDDNVEINGTVGTVEAVTLRRTVLRDLQGKVHHFPNGAITRVTNETYGWAQVLIHLKLGFESDLDQVEALVNRVGDELFADPAWRERLEGPPRFIGLVAFDDGALRVRIMFRTQTFEQWPAEREFNRRLKKEFEIVGIRIVRPEREIHFLSDPGELPKPGRDAGPSQEEARDEEVRKDEARHPSEEGPSAVEPVTADRPREPSPEEAGGETRDDEGESVSPGKLS